MNIAAYANAGVAGVPILFVVLGLVQWTKSFGVEGKALRAVSMVIGLLLGAGFMIASAGLPGAFPGWFAVVVYGLGLGVVASGVYDAAEKIVANALAANK